MLKALLVVVLASLPSVVPYPTKRPDVTDTVDNPLKFVDLFYGTENGGHMFPGSTRPFGMAKLGIDVIDSSFGDPYSGYAPGGVITGVSMMHESGTGGAPEYGLVSQLPFLGDFNPSQEPNLTRAQKDYATVGYYQFNSTEGIVGDFAAAERSGILRFQYPPNSNPQLLVNVAHHLASPGRPWWTQYFVNGSIDANYDLSGYSGFTSLKGGWGDQTEWTLYFYTEFEQPASTVKSYKKTNVTEDNLHIASDEQDISFGLVFGWDESVDVVQSKIGISFISVNQAQQNLRKDFNDTNVYDLEQVVNETQQIWLDEVFSKVSIASDNDTISEYLYTSLYGAHLMPSNRTGENPNWLDENNSPITDTYYDDWFTIWDTFRSLNPLFNILNPVRGSELVQSLITIYKYDGWTPDGRSANQNGRTQGGSNSDIVMADAYVKSIPGIDWEIAFEAMVQNAEVNPPYWYDSFAPDASTKQGRGGLPDWLEYGFITRKYTRSLTRTIEYAYDDFALAVVAQGLGNQTAYERYLKRSANWQNIWNENATADGYDYQGFIQPRDSNGTWRYDNYNPFSCGGCYWGDDTYEGKPVEYGWSVPQDIETLIELMGGNETFIKRLDDMYSLHGKEEVVDVGNEPSFLTPYLYNYVNQQHRTVETTRWIINKYFTTGTGGLPGNSDAGAMQSWLIFGLWGFYPVAGTTTYLISSPHSRYFWIDLGGGKSLEIIADNLSDQNVYVQSVTINGIPHTQNWVDHDTLFNIGGSIEFVLTDQPVAWETGDVPPSPGHYKII